MTAKQKAARAKFKAVVKEASKLRKKNPKLTQAQAVKQAFAISYEKDRRNPIKRIKKAVTDYVSKAKEDFKKGYYGEEYGKKSRRKKVGAAPTKVKAKKSKRTSEMHTDTKSHNVNIRVISGTKDDIISKYVKANNDIEKLEKVLLRNKETQKKPPYKTDFWKKHFVYQNKLIKKYITELKKHKAELKKLM